MVKIITERSYTCAKTGCHENYEYDKYTATPVKGQV